MGGDDSAQLESKAVAALTPASRLLTMCASVQVISPVGAACDVEFRIDFELGAAERGFLGPVVNVVFADVASRQITAFTERCCLLESTTTGVEAAAETAGPRFRRRHGSSPITGRILER